MKQEDLLAELPNYVTIPANYLCNLAIAVFTLLSTLFLGVLRLGYKDLVNDVDKKMDAKIEAMEKKLDDKIESKFTLLMNAILQK